MAAHFNAGQSGYSWMASSYLLANAACIPLWGKISDIWGRKPILLLANFVFLVASLICGLSTSLTMIIVGRSIQGIGAGGLIVLGNICITDLFSLRSVYPQSCPHVERATDRKHQGTAHVLWFVWCHLGDRKCFGPSNWRRVYNQSNVEVVLLPESYVPLFCHFLFLFLEISGSVDSLYSASGVL